MPLLPLWITVLLACVLAVVLLKRLFGPRAPMPLQRRRLSFDQRDDAPGVAQERLFRLGRLSLGDGTGDGKP